MTTLSLVFAAISIGLAAGLKPGPLGIYVIHQTLSRSVRQGFLSSLAPLITDGPIMLVALFAVQRLNDYDGLIGCISIAGGVYLVVIAFRIFQTTEIAPRESNTIEVSSLIGAIKLNLLNPAPYLFWLTIGGSFIAAGTATQGLLFAVLMSITLCLTKFTVAVAIKILGKRVSKSMYSRLLRLLAIPLLFFSLKLFYDGVNRLTA